MFSYQLLVKSKKLHEGAFALIFTELQTLAISRKQHFASRELLLL